MRAVNDNQNEKVQRKPKRKRGMRADGGGLRADGGVNSLNGKVPFDNGVCRISELGEVGFVEKIIHGHHFVNT